MRDDELNLIKMELDRHALPATNNELAPSQLAHQLESIAAASRSLETALLRERHYSKQLREYVNQVLTRMHFLQKQEREAVERLKELQSNHQSGAQQVQDLTLELQKSKHELTQYRNAWAQILSREKHAQYILSRGEGSAKRIQELELALTTLEKRISAEKAGREKAEGHASMHRQELQTTLVRLHSSEARYNDMARELEAIHTLRKNHTLELSRVEQVAREKLESQFAREREQLLQEISHEREEYSRHRQDFEQLKRELEAKYGAEIQRLKSQAQLEQQKASETLRGEVSHEISKMESIIRSLGEEAVSLRGELSQARTEVASIEHSSRQVELELLRAREEVVQLQRQLSEERSLKSALQNEIVSTQELVQQELRQELGRERDAAKAAAEKHREDLESQRGNSLRAHQELCDLIQTDRKQMKKLIEKLIAEWGTEDQALSEALESLREACEVRTVRTDAPPAKLEIVASGGSRLNC
jgi:chromosome segregation ATPase